MLHVRGGAELDRNLVFKQGSCFFSSIPLFSRMFHIHGSEVRDGTLHAADAVTSTQPGAVEVATHSVSRLAEMH